MPNEIKEKMRQIEQLQARIAELEAENANLNDWLKTWKESFNLAQAKIAKLKATAIVWHKYPDEKPPLDGQLYIVAYAIGGGKIRVCESWFYGKFECEDYATIPTHWAYLPAPPKEVEK